MNRIPCFRSLFFVAIFILATYTSYAQKAPFKGSMDVKVLSGKVVDGKPQFKAPQTRKVYFKGDQFLVDSVKIQNNTVRILVDQSTRKLHMLFLPGGDMPMAIGATMDLKFVIKMGLSRSAEKNNLDWGKGVQMKFTESKEKKTLSGLTAKRMDVQAGNPSAPVNKKDTMSLWMTDKAGLKLSDYNQFFLAISDTSYLDDMRAAVSKAPASIKNGWPLQIYFRSDAKGTMTNVYFQNIKNKLTAEQEAMFDTSGFMMMDIEQFVTPEMMNQMQQEAPAEPETAPDPDMDSAPGE